MKYLMGIDNGGTFSKVGIFDEEGNQIAVASVHTVTITPKPGYTERDLNDLWDVNAQAIRNAIEKSKVAPSDIVGVSFFRTWGRTVYGGRRDSCSSWYV